MSDERREEMRKTALELAVKAFAACPALFEKRSPQGTTVGRMIVQEAKIIYDYLCQGLEGKP